MPIMESEIPILVSSFAKNASVTKRETKYSKVLCATGMKQSELMSLENGLRLELAAHSAGSIRPDAEIYSRMDKFFGIK